MRLYIPDFWNYGLNEEREYNPDPDYSPPEFCAADPCIMMHDGMWDLENNNEFRPPCFDAANIRYVALQKQPCIDCFWEHEEWFEDEFGDFPDCTLIYAELNIDDDGVERVCPPELVELPHVSYADGVECSCGPQPASQTLATSSATVSISLLGQER